MTSLEKIVIELRQKKREATKLKQNAETQLKQLQSAEKRSATGLQKMIKQIESEKEDVSDVSENLTRKNAQVESIQRLVSVAEDRVNSEKEIVDQTEQEIEFAETPEEKQNAEARLRSLNDHIQELISLAKFCSATRCRVSCLPASLTGPSARLLPPHIICFPAIGTNSTVFVSPGSKRTAVPAGISNRCP